jgi:hypothetical protein
LPEADRHFSPGNYAAASFMAYSAVANVLLVVVLAANNV